MEDIYKIVMSHEALKTVIDLDFSGALLHITSYHLSSGYGNEPALRLKPDASFTTSVTIVMENGKTNSLNLDSMKIYQSFVR